MIVCTTSEEKVVKMTSKDDKHFLELLSFQVLKVELELPVAQKYIPQLILHEMPYNAFCGFMLSVN
jgi:hypothetical protein